jgi:ankyrin repeat protein
MKFYKIINKNETHNGMTYHDGLNEDVLPFNPSGDCTPEGIYFTDVENILAFMKYDSWLWEVTIPEGEEIYENPGTPKKWKAHRIILSKRAPLLGSIPQLLKEGAHVHADNDYALKWASYYGYLEVVKTLLEAGANVRADNDYALKWASRNGHLEVVKTLLKAGASVHTEDDLALRWASLNGHLEVVKTLLEAGADVHADNDSALRWASLNGYLEVVKTLLKAGANVNAYALSCAAENGHLEVAKVLKQVMKAET